MWRTRRVGMGMAMTGKLDTHFSEASEPVTWQQVSDALTTAELYWLTTVRQDGRPHVTPLVGPWVDDGFGHTDDSGDSHIARVYRVPAVKVLAFAKCPHGQATFRF